MIEFDNVKFPKDLSSKDGVWKEFLDIDSNGRSSEKWVLQKRKLSYTLFKSTSYKNVVETKQIYFSPTFSKSWVCTSDNVVGVLWSPQY